MPSSGKTTLAKILSKKRSIPYFDSDEEIIKRTHMSIPDIFQIYQEAGFRKIEQEVLITLSTKQGCIISTGGGAVTNEKAMCELKKNGIILFIDRHPSLLQTKDPNRPLSFSSQDIMKLYTNRIELYRKYADEIIPNNGRIEEALQALGGIIDDYHNY